jgi:hypothetical protein
VVQIGSQITWSCFLKHLTWQKQGCKTNSKLNSWFKGYGYFHICNKKDLVHVICIGLQEHLAMRAPHDHECLSIKELWVYFITTRRKMYYSNNATYLKEHFPPNWFWRLLTIHYLLMCDYALQDFIIVLHKILGFICYIWYVSLSKGNYWGNGEIQLREKFQGKVGQGGRL